MKKSSLSARYANSKMDFRATINFGCACACVLALTPFSVNNFIQGRLTIGIASLGIIVVSIFNGLSIIKGRFYPQLVFIGLVPFIISGTFFATYNHGIIGVLWCFPAVLAFYCMLTERQAWLANAVLLLIIFPTQWYVLDRAVVIRAMITLMFISALSAIFTRVISNQQMRLEEAKDHAEKTSRAKSEFFANMSHELRTPLNAILGFTQLMTRETGVSTNQLNNLTTISRTGEHLLSLINNVLEFSKIEAGQITLSEEKIDVHQLLLSIKDMFVLRTQQKGLSLTIEKGSDVPQYILADENKLRQVLINLLGNATKYSNSGGIKLLLKVKESGKCQQNNEVLLQIEVVDSGIGIYPSDQEKIFDAFFQSEDDRSLQQGTGLGLPISRRLAVLMGGTLIVSSKVGKGSIFTLDIPVKTVENTINESSLFTRRVDRLEEGQIPFRILVVEDNENNRNMLVSLLESVGFNVMEAVNGMTAVRIWEDWQPHLIWMDMRMPVLNGYDATSIIKDKIKKTEQGMSTVIIALTASAFEEDRAKVIAHGCNDFVSKPVRESEIFKMLEKHLGVKFKYQEGHKNDNFLIDEEITNKLKSGALSSEILDRLKEATELSDAAMISTIIENIRIENSHIANNLQRLAENYAYDEILDLMLGAEEKTTLKK